MGDTKYKKLNMLLDKVVKQTEEAGELIETLQEAKKLVADLKKRKADMESIYLELKKENERRKSGN